MSDTIVQVVIAETPTNVDIIDETTAVITDGSLSVEVLDVGIQGPSGAGTDLNFTFSISVPSTTWTINHNLGKFPSPYIEVGGYQMLADVQQLNPNSLVISFLTPRMGKCYLN